MLQRIRTEEGYKPLDELKFETNARPKHVSIEQAKRAKARVIRACQEHGCIFIVNVVLLAIAKNTAREELIRRGSNHVIGRYNFFLGQRAAKGCVIVDRLPKGVEFEYLQQKFTVGLEFDDSAPVRLDNVVLYASSCINASHLASAVDIVLGAFRYCINKPKNLEAAKEMMVAVTSMVWHVRKGNDIHAAEMGLVFRPKSIKVEKYKARYQWLLDHMNELIKDAEIPPPPA